jgi:hypothetical protein
LIGPADAFFVVNVGGKIQLVGSSDIGPGGAMPSRRPALASTNLDVYFLDASEDLGGSVPPGTPAVTNLIYAHSGPGTVATYFADTPSQNESFGGGNHHWATIAVEIKGP